RGVGRGSPGDAGGRAGPGGGAALEVPVRRPVAATPAIGHRRRLDARAEAGEVPADARPPVVAEPGQDGSLDEPRPVRTVGLGGPFVLAQGEATDGEVGLTAFGNDTILQVWNLT